MADGGGVAANDVDDDDDDDDEIDCRKQGERKADAPATATSAEDRRDGRILVFIVVAIGDDDMGSD